jgi:serine/threonine-protein phosphatase 6 catalytic subunit
MPRACPPDAYRTRAQVWSAPNYCYRCGNVASILIFDDKLNRDVRYFTETQENSSMMAPRTTARYFW